MFKDIETVLHILSCAAVRKIVDSSGRVLGIGPDKMEAACQVALNGPPLAQSENIIEAAQGSLTLLERCQEKGKIRDGNFVRKSCNTIVSKSVDRLCGQKPNRLFMM